MISEAFKYYVAHVQQASAYIRGATSHDFSAGTQDIALATDGSIDPTFIATFQQDPRLRFTTVDLAGALAACGIGGLAVSTSPTLFYYAKMDPLSGAAAAGSGHIAARMTRGIMVPTSISARQGGEASVGIECAAVWNGTQNPVDWLTSQSLPSVTPNVVGWTVGPVQINGTLFEGVQSIDVDMGIDVRRMYGDGELWPTYSPIRRREPQIRISGLSASALASIGLGVAQDDKSTKVCFRRKTNYAGNQASNASGHVVLSIAAGTIRVEGSSSGDEMSVDVVIRPVSDGVNAIVAINTNATLPS